MESAGQNRNKVGTLLILFFMLILYFTVFSFYGGRLFDQVFLADTVFDEDTFIGSEKVDALTDAETVRMLNEKVEAWQQEADITFKYVEKEAEMSVGLVSFQVEESVSQAADSQKNPLIASINAADLSEELKRKMPSLRVADQLDTNMLASDLADIADYLKTGESVIDLSLYLPEETRNSKVAEVVAEGMDDAAADFIKANPAISIKNNSSVSFNSWVEPAGDKISEKSLNILSSSLYRLVLKTNFDIMEKNQSTELPEYIELGYEASIDKAKNQDFVFFNRNDHSYTINWTVTNGKLYGALTGLPFYYTYAPELKNKETLKAKTVLHFSPLLDYGTMRVEQYGESGMMIDLYRNRLEGSEKRESEQVAADFYPPVHQIELYSSQEPPPPPPPEPEEEETTDDEEAGQAADAEEDQNQSEEESQSDEEDSTENGQ